MAKKNTKTTKHIKKLSEIVSKRVTYKLINKLEIDSEKKDNTKVIQKERQNFICNAMEYLVRRKARECAANEVYEPSVYYPTVYERRYDLSDETNVIVIVIYKQDTDTYHVFFRDYTEPNKPFYGELYGTPYLAEWISAVKWNGNTKSYEYLPQGIIPNIWSTSSLSRKSNSSPIWATPNFRPYLRRVQEYIQNGGLFNDLKIYTKLYYHGK